MSNICKYAMPGTRVYLTTEREGDTARMVVRNISRYPLNISADELTERFVRGDESRSTEGSGLGLAITKRLVEEMDGYAAARAIRALPDEKQASVPIIAVTANAFSEDVAATTAAGIDAHISKPIDAAVLRQTLERLMGPRA